MAAITHVLGSNNNAKFIFPHEFLTFFPDFANVNFRLESISGGTWIVTGVKEQGKFDCLLICGYMEKKTSLCPFNSFFCVYDALVRSELVVQRRQKKIPKHAVQRED